jgi:hypothetical protein
VQDLSPTVEITKAELKDLRESQLWLSCLEDAGVDNWDGISFAHELMEQQWKEFNDGY